MKFSKKPVGLEFTDVELRVFFALKKLGVIFTTQYPFEIEPKKRFWFDFCISRLNYPTMIYKLIDIEADSDLHDADKDYERDKLLRERDVFVIRINDNDFKTSSEIAEYLKQELKRVGVPLWVGLKLKN